MSIPGNRVLTSEQMAGYRESGFVRSLPRYSSGSLRHRKNRSSRHAGTISEIR
jgi:hypothetical protein